MAYLNVTQRCGHTTKIAVSDGSLQNHDVRYHGGKLCEDCRKQRVMGILDKENAAAWERSRELGWPELRGTIKQIVWATSLRLKMVQRLIGTAIEMNIPDDVADAYLEEFFAHNSAKWWINNRNMSMVALLEYPLDLS